MAVAATAGLPRDPVRSVSTAQPVRAGWALFDSRVALGDLAPAKTTASAVSKTSNGRDVHVSIRRLATPPACSCLQLYTDDKVFRKPSIVAVDGDLLLIHMVVAVKCMPKLMYPHNFFVFKADPEFPKLHSIPPPCDWLAHGKNTAITRSGNGFVLTNLRTCRFTDETTMREVEVAIVWLYRSATEEWETKQLNMPFDTEKGLVECVWATDTVLSFRGFVCWVDYHHGILYCNILSPEPELGFHPFPGIEMWRGDRQLPTMYRTVSIFRGHLKFVNIDNGRFRSIESENNGYTRNHDNRCVIKTWTLKMPEFEWEEDAILQLQELWSLPSYQDSPLPRVVPTFPIIDLQETNILHFVLRKPGFYEKAWMVTVDIKKKLIRQHAVYQNPVEEDCGVDLTNVFLNLPLVPIQVSK